MDDQQGEVDMNSNEVNMERLVSDLRVVARDAEDLLKATAGELGERAKEARARLESSLDAAKSTCDRYEEKFIESARATDKVIREHPYESLGIALGFGMLLGCLLNRR
jgi:ElaB/YqjD/DUF883 family membrane-anchored ribosome-binding protein